MLGRSDGVLNPGGIRFGPTDIYSVLENAPEFADAGVEETLVVGLMVDGGADEAVILFVKVSDTITLLKEPCATCVRSRHQGEGPTDAQMSSQHSLTDELVKRIKTAIRVGRSARHVPAKVSRLFLH